MGIGILERTDYLCEILGIEIPIFQGAMAEISDGFLAGCVSESGGLGTIAAGGLEASALYNEIETLKKITQKPFAVNLPLKSENILDLLNIVKECKVPIIVTGAGNPEKYIPELKASDCKVIPVVGSVALAKRLCRFGIDAVIAEGCEAGGHVGTVTTMCLVPQIVRCVPIPVIVAGGIADGSGMAAGLALGAWGIQMGTRFLLTKESSAHKNYKEAIIKAKDISTVVLNALRVDRDNIRALKSEFTSKYIDLESMESDMADRMMKGALSKAVKEGDGSVGVYMAGQAAGLLCEEESVCDVIHNTWNMACKILKI